MDFVDCNSKPIIGTGLVNNMMSQLYGMDVLSVKEVESYIDRNYFVDVKKSHNNPYIKEICPHGYVLKIFNTKESKDDDYFEACFSVVDYLREHNIPAPGRIQRVDGKFMNVEALSIDPNKPDSTKNYHMVILLALIPRVTLSTVPLVPSLLYDAGKLLGRIDKLLQNFSHPYYNNCHPVIWNAEQLPTLSKYLKFIEIESDQIIIEEVIETFKEEFLPNLSKYQKGHTHGDFSDLNIIVKEKNEKPELQYFGFIKEESSPEFVISGVIDFAHNKRSYLVHEVAIAIAYISLESKVIDPLDVGGHILAGYMTEVKLNSDELDALRILICGRLSKSLAIGRYIYQQDTTNLYPLKTSGKGWPLLRKFWKTPNEEIVKRWKEIINSYGEN